MLFGFLFFVDCAFLPPKLTRSQRSGPCRETLMGGLVPVSHERHFLPFWPGLFKLRVFGTTALGDFLVRIFSKPQSLTIPGAPPPGEPQPLPRGKVTHLFVPSPFPKPPRAGHPGALRVSHVEPFSRRSWVFVFRPFPAHEKCLGRPLRAPAISKRCDKTPDSLR